VLWGLRYYIGSGRKIWLFMGLMIEDFVRDQETQPRLAVQISNRLSLTKSILWGCLQGIIRCSNLGRQFKLPF
jgi:hypothetical protein